MSRIRKVVTFFMLNFGQNAGIDELQKNLFMPEEIQPAPAPETQVSKPEKIQEVYVLREWKEYIGEALLIIFSVFLGLAFTEWINSMHERSETREIVNGIRQELINNKKGEQEQYEYQARALRTIDSALTNVSIQQEILQGDDFKLTRIFPEGILYRDLSSTAWEVAKAQNLAKRMPLSTITLLTSVYENQSRIPKTEDEIAKIIFSRESRKPENLHTTLLLIRDNLKGWAFDRALGLITQYDQCIAVLGNEIP